MPQLEAFEERTLPSTFTVMNLNDSGTGSLRAAIASANSHAGADIIAFANGLHGTITLTSGELLITDSVTINGPGANKLTISGNNAQQIFDISGGTTVTLTDLTVADGLAVQGGGIDNFGNLTVKNCSLLGNQAVGGSGDATTPDAANGGGIANEVGGSLTLTNSLLENNIAAASAGNDSFGGAVLNLGSATVTGCTFTGDEVTGGGSGSYYDGSYGGAIESFGFPPSQLYGSTLTVSHSTFSHNQAIAASGVTFGDAAAIDVEFSAVATINNCTFTDNVGTAGDSGYGQGGALFAEGCTLTLSNSTFTGNQALGGTSGGGAEGGAIFLLSTPASSLSPATTLNVVNCGFTGNQAIAGNDAPAPVAFNSPGGQGLGGAINDSGAAVSLTGCTLTGNQAIGGSAGPNPTFGNLSGSNEYGAGGAIILLDGATMTVANCALVDNMAEGGSSTAGTGGPASGGGIEDSSGIPPAPSTALTLSNSTLVGNQALGGAGADGVAGGVATGGGLDLSFSATATVSKTTFLSNSAQGGAGGNGANGGDGFGGGIAVASQSFFGFPDTCSLSLNGSALLGNSAQGGAGGAGGIGGNGEGGGVFVGPGGTATINQTTLFANLALGGDGLSGGDGLGGGCYVASGASLSVTDSAILLNLAHGGDGKHSGSDGEGIGGGVYTVGTFTYDALTFIVFNLASSHGNNIGP
ncbi:MAG TPA: hypothetical protein VGP68_03290 [Gemmataceae bacterium]|nr:hypothetical protein [Gemmataceae bacterium]